MPHQKPLIDLDKLDRNRGEQLKAIDGLAARLQPGIARDGYSVSVQTQIALMRVFDSVCSPKCPVNWLGIKHWSEMAGMSTVQCGRAISVLKSCQMIEAHVTWVAFGRRGMKVSINWSKIFDTSAITQDQEDVTLWRAKRVRQRRLFSRKAQPVIVSENNVVIVSETNVVTVSENNVVIVSSTSNPQIDPLNQSAAGEGVDEGSFQLSAVNHQQENDDVTTGTGDPGTNPQPHVRVRDAFGSGGDGSGSDVSKQRDYDHGGDRRNPQETRIEGHSRTSTVPPADLIQTLVALNVADPRSAVKKSLTAGYTLDQIRAIVSWYQAEALTDEHGKLVFPYDPGQLVLRLRDRDAKNASPAQGNWKGGLSGFWTRLAPISTPNPRKPARERPATTKPDRIPVPTTYTTPMSLSAIEEAMDTNQAPATVRQSANRLHDPRQALPKTLAFWLKSQGLPVEESQQRAEK